MSGRIAGSAASGIRERKGEARPHSSPARFFSPPLTESLEQATFWVLRSAFGVRRSAFGKFQGFAAVQGYSLCSLHDNSQLGIHSEGMGPSHYSNMAPNSCGSCCLRASYGRFGG